MQELDSRIARLTHQRRTLPEIAEIEQLHATRTGLEDQVRDARIVVDDLTVDQKKADRDVELVKTRRKRDSERMDQGLITNPKDLSRMQAELVSLDRRIATLEDEELEIMALLEDAEREKERLSGEVAVLDERMAVLTAARDEKAAEIDADLESVRTARAAAAEGLPEDLVALYDKLRDKQGGVGAAPLRARQCGGCRLTVDTAELAVIKAAPSDEVIRCEECSRILVRTDESGL